MNLVTILLLFFFVFIGPVFTIMALNTLFTTGINLSIGTWFATFWLHLIIATKTNS